MNRNSIAKTLLASAIFTMCFAFVGCDNTSADNPQGLKSRDNDPNVTPVQAPGGENADTALGKAADDSSTPRRAPGGGN